MQASICKLLQASLRLYPLYSGAGTLANTRLPAWASSVLGDRAVTTLRSGVRLIVNPQECLGRSVYYTGEWDPKITWVINRLLRTGDTFIDIGAHCGVIAVAGAARVGASGMVHAFEPQPDLAAMLKASASANGFMNVRVHNIALSDRTGEMNLFIPANKQVLATLEGDGGDHPSIRVPVECASDYLKNLNLKHIRLIKIDVEGHEETLLRGARDYLAKTPPDAILFESVPTEGPFWRRPAVMLLSTMGYHFIAVPKRLIRMSTHLVLDSEPDPACHDFVAAQLHTLDQITDALDTRSHKKPPSPPPMKKVHPPPKRFAVQKF